VSINLFVKNGKKKPDALAEVWHCDLWGKREQKYDNLIKNNLSTLSLTGSPYSAPYFFFHPKDESGKTTYETGFCVDKLFPLNVTGIVTARDHVVIDFDSTALLERIEQVCNPAFSDEEIREHLFPGKKSGKYLAGDSRGWKLSSARQKIRTNDHQSLIKELSHHPFDTRMIYYSPDMVDWGREAYMPHFFRGENVGLVIPKINKEDHAFFITKNIMTHKLCSAYDSNSAFPLYLYPDGGQLDLGGTGTRKPNLSPEIVARIAERIGLEFTNEKENRDGTFAPIDLLDYIYAVLHSPTYREKYKEFLKIDFPRVPYPTDVEKFWQLVQLGGELRQIHLLESPVVEKFITRYPIDGDNTVTRSMTTKSVGYEPVSKESGRVWINDTQYFENIPLIAWEFYIGGYQPAQKWLKDRNGRTLSFDDIRHYQKIIVALTETDRLMKAIDQIGVE
jgi:predicted helicase